MFVGHSRIWAGHACRNVCLKACTTGLRGLHCGLVGGDREQALLCELAVRSREGAKATRENTYRRGR